MAIPFIAPLAGFAKGMLGVKGAAAAGAAAKGAAARAGATRFAGDAMKNYLGGKVTPMRLAENFALDGVFGVMAGMNSPGDLGDKLIAGTTVGLSGGIGGMLGTTAYGKIFNKGRMPTGIARQMTEVGGAMLGDEVGFGLSESLQRLKGGGTTPYEKMAQEGNADQQQQIEREVLSKYGLLQGIPTGYHYGSDPFLVDNGLA